MDTLQLAAAAPFFQQQLAGQNVQKIALATGGIYLQAGRQILACIVQRAPLGLWLTTESTIFQEAAAPSQQLQQRLKGFVISNISVPWADRIVRLDFSRIHISKRVDRWSLIAECFGGRGNLALLDAEEKIRWAMRWDSLDAPAAPRFLPGIRYQAPAPARQFVTAAVDSALWLTLMAPRYRPATLSAQNYLQEQWAARNATDSWWQSSPPHPMVYPLRLTDTSPMAEISPETALQLPMASVSQAPSIAEQILSAEKKRLEQRIHKMRLDLQQWEAPEHYRTLAFALFALPDAICRKSPIQATDHTHQDGPVLEITVTPGKTLHQQAQQYMQKALKSQRATQKIHQRLEDSEKMLDALNTKGVEALSRARELYPKPPIQGLRKTSGRFSQPPTESFHEALVAGFSILWGNNARENDRLTFRHAKPWDLWFHVQDLSGSHVVLRRSHAQLAVPETVIATAARLALQHSQSRALSAEVDWTEIRHVQRKPGGGPGQVIYRHFQTIRIRRDT
ncbi:hypothetical protein B1757_03760 [Acidithiobacillus marinus]|uniref:NFACT RNA-binding domain-containing protein n=1 Tax=Acidithiobacillus marinus TaxID=187490 RepID=A0A2I1DNY2_9PROT|nr:NFACT RNA binding domain-containing protein [Acidithiobacillus marinus]PKY11604.1 hypothetical protein B1757_03760 [Acidithiobacillus marinus]